MTPSQTMDPEARLTELVDGSLEPASPEELEALFAADPALRQSFEDARGARALLSELPQKAAPRDFLRKVQRRVRRKSGGRYFHPAQPSLSYKISIEVFVVIAVAVMAACWFFLEAAKPMAPGPLVEEPQISQPAEPPAP